MRFVGSNENIFSAREEQDCFEINIEDDLTQAIPDSVYRLIKSIDNNCV